MTGKSCLPLYQQAVLNILLAMVIGVRQTLQTNRTFLAYIDSLLSENSSPQKRISAFEHSHFYASPQWILVICKHRRAVQ